MPQDTPATPRTKLFLAAAAAALTVAAGLTAGALLGFVRAPDTAAVASTTPSLDPAVADAPAAGEAAAGLPVEEDPFAPEPAWTGGERGAGEREGESREHRGEGRGREEGEEDDDD